MRGWAVMASVLAHAAGVTGLVFAMPAARPVIPRTLPIHVKVMPAAVAPHASPGPARPALAPTAVAHSPEPARPRRTSLPAPRAAPSSPEPAPAPAPAVNPMMAMRLPVAAAARITIPAPESAVHDDAAHDSGDAAPGANLDGPINIPHVPGPHSGGAATALGGTAEGDGNGGFREEHGTFTARVKRDGSAHFEDAANFAFDSPLSAHFDLTDMVMRWAGNDPYQYEKERFLDRTRDARNQMALSDRSDKLRGAIDRMPAYLSKIWANPKWTAAQRRRVIFALWDEVAETGDAELLHAGVEVRATILAWIHKHLPAGSADAYAAAELEALNKSRSGKATFAPY